MKQQENCFSATTLKSDNTIVVQVMNPKCEKIVRTIARLFTNNPDDQQDLMQEGYIGLMEAAKRYDPSTGVQFDSYASWWVRKYMRAWMLNNSQIVRLSCKTEDYYKPLNARLMLCLPKKVVYKRVEGGEKPMAPEHQSIITLSSPYLHLIFTFGTPLKNVPHIKSQRSCAERQDKDIV